MLDKKANGVVIVLVIIIIIVVIAWLVGLAGRECKNDSDCGADHYCGSDYSCHEFKIVQKTEVNYDLLMPSFVIGIAIIIGAVILRYRKG